MKGKSSCAGHGKGKIGDKDRIRLREHQTSQKNQLKLQKVPDIT